MKSFNMQLRLTAALPLVLTGIAIILSFLCVFAGTNHDMIEDADIFLLNTSKIGINLAQNPKTPTSSGLGPLASEFSSVIGRGVEDTISSAAHSAASEVSTQAAAVQSQAAADKQTVESGHAGAAVKNKVEGDFNKEIGKLLKDIGLKDFYSIHILNFCDGYFKNNTHGGRNVTHCSNSTGSFAFDPAKTLQNDLNNATHGKVNLTELHFPSEVEHAIRDIRWVFHLMFVLYCFGLVFICFAFLANIAGIFMPRGHLVPLINVALAFMSLLSLIIASGAVTYAGKHATNAINKYGKDIDISAIRGMKFVQMTWTAVTLVGLSTVCWIVEFVLARRRRKMMAKEYSPKNFGEGSQY